MSGQNGADRRDFLKLAGGTAASAALLAPIAKALALPAAGPTGTLQDLEHVVIFMQENRSFDHYFGTLSGVRGYADPRPLTLPGGASVFQQPRKGGDSGPVTPFRLDGQRTNAQGMHSLDHSWKGSHNRWKWHDAWIGAKSELTMGYFTREDLPFYYALADAFTICDAYHCSIFGPTNPNRLFLFTGTSGLAVGEAGHQVIANPLQELNETSDPAHDSGFKGFNWTTYAERLQAADVSWKVYQEYDNYGDNGLAYFAKFRGVDPGSEAFRRARAWAEGSNAKNAKTSNGEHLVAAFAKDVAADTLPQVSWIVAPYRLCEHPSATPADGEALTAALIAALADNPKVWAKTAFILTYDENDGFFDHIPPLVPPVGQAQGKSTVALDGELYGQTPVGLGPRVPTIVVSPWTRGGWVNSQLFDHTSILRLLEARFGVAEPNITAWRRAMTGDLTSVFDFSAAGDRPALPDAASLPDRAHDQARLPAARAPQVASALPRQEAGRRPARALPYAVEATGDVSSGVFRLAIENTGRAGAGFTLYPDDPKLGGPWSYAVEAGKRLTDEIALKPGSYGFTLHGPNGFLRRFAGEGADPVAVAARFDLTANALVLAMKNQGQAPAQVRIADAYGTADRRRSLAPGETAEEAWPMADHDHWYDLSVALEGRDGALRRLAGHIETGRPSRSDPALDRDGAKG